jgi:hypothetical protein
VVYGWQQVRGGVDRADISVGLWLVYYLLAILVMSAIGSFGGTGIIKAPWDSVVVAVIGAVAFFRGVHDSQRHLAAHPAPVPEGDRAPARR